MYKCILHRSDNQTKIINIEHVLNNYEVQLFS